MDQENLLRSKQKRLTSLKEILEQQLRNKTIFAQQGMVYGPPVSWPIDIRNKHDATQEYIESVEQEIEQVKEEIKQLEQNIKRKRATVEVSGEKAAQASTPKVPATAEAQLSAAPSRTVRHSESRSPTTQSREDVTDTQTVHVRATEATAPEAQSGPGVTSRSPTRADQGSAIAQKGSNPEAWQGARRVRRAEPEPELDGVVGNVVLAGLGGAILGGLGLALLGVLAGVLFEAGSSFAERALVWSIPAGQWGAILGVIAMALAQISGGAWGKALAVSRALLCPIANDGTWFIYGGPPGMLVGGVGGALRAGWWGAALGLILGLLAGASLGAMSEALLRPSLLVAGGAKVIGMSIGCIAASLLIGPVLFTFGIGGGVILTTGGLRALIWGVWGAGLLAVVFAVLRHFEPEPQEGFWDNVVEGGVVGAYIGALGATCIKLFEEQRSGISASTWVIIAFAVVGALIGGFIGSRKESAPAAIRNAISIGIIGLGAGTILGLISITIWDAYVVRNASSAELVQATVAFSVAIGTLVGAWNGARAEGFEQPFMLLLIGALVVGGGGAIVGALLEVIDAGVEEVGPTALLWFLGGALCGALWLPIAAAIANHTPRR